MDLRPITEQFAVAPQIAPEEVPEIARAGFRTIICNRPDDEDPEQPSHAQIEAAAQEEDIAFLMLPVRSGVLTEEAVNGFREALDTMPGPILAYCRSGTRCTMLWSIAQFGRMDPDEIVAKAAEAGYDMSGLMAQLRATRT
ncbi:TIGR01244 family phosphatase [Roseovarius sp. SCSIO 43702]|uniref:TIGR01244 family sulfur transferase n=1 Tax=Roseovarius sp. SCSIO 43702 TaxID=2823043 RepID=UPI001C72B95A|nr:TIGR01244 family sulfur transferase [Roseovarius sp. SCSIO 43702]QYX57041.1 TIGR01244 family phosphatase [Roseovarius sp. SCSIO 43702]